MTASTREINAGIYRDQLAELDRDLAAGTIAETDHAQARGELQRRLLDDALLIKKGMLDTVPMGYLFNGPVGTGKSFLAQCLAGSIGVPDSSCTSLRSATVSCAAPGCGARHSPASIPIACPV